MRRHALSCSRSELVCWSAALKAVERKRGVISELGVRIVAAMSAAFLLFPLSQLSSFLRVEGVLKFANLPISVSSQGSWRELRKCKNEGFLFFPFRFLYFATQMQFALTMHALPFCVNNFLCSYSLYILFTLSLCIYLSVAIRELLLAIVSWLKAMLCY